MMETKNTNLDLWNEYERTDPAYTKQSNISGMLRTSVDAQYKKRMITKAFGTVGIGWGIEPESEKYDRQEYEGGTIILTYKAVAFYKLEGQTGRIPIAAAIKECYMTRGANAYLKIDEEAIKKVRTDALTKGFTDLGFCSDINLGKFEDSTYVTAAYARAELEKEEFTNEAIEKAKSNIADWVTKEIESCKKILPKNESGFKAAMSGVRKKLITKCAAANINNQNWVKKLDAVTAEELGKLEPVQK